MRRPGATLEAVLDMMMEGVLIALLVFTPLVFGTVQTWAISLMEAGIAILAGLWICRLIWSRSPTRPARSLPESEGRVNFLGYRFLRTRLGAPIVLFLMVVALQLLPLPPSAVGALSPESARVFERSLPGYSDTTEVDFTRIEPWLTGTDEGVIRGLLEEECALPVYPRLGSSRARPLSVYPFATATRLMIFLVLLAGFLVSAHLLSDRAQIERISWVVILIGLAMSVFAVVQRVQWNGRIYWFYPVPADASPFGPFLNYNHFAAYLEMAAPLALGMFLARAVNMAGPRGRSGDAPAAPADEGEGYFAGLRRQPPEALARLGMSGFAAVIMLSVLAMSGSRGAILSLGAAVAIYGAVGLLRGTVGRIEWVVGITTVVLALVFAAWIGSEQLGEMGRRLQSVATFQSEPSLSARVVGWRATLDIVADYPVFGAGLGTFPAVWLHYYPPGTANIWKEAHNDYLQIASETGLAGLAALAWGMIIFLKRYLFSLRPRRPAAWPGDKYLHDAMAIGVLSILLHSFVDFGLQVNAIALLFVVLSAIMVGNTIRHSEA